MKRILIILLIIFSAFIVIADGENNSNISNINISTLTGTVIDKKTGELLVGVEINIEGTKLKAYTDFDGKFKFENINLVEYKIVTNYISYEKQYLTFKSNQKNINIKLNNLE